MKTFLVLLVILFAFSGCATIGKHVVDDVAVVNTALDALLPATFTGPAHISRSDGYVDIKLDAGDLKKDASGKWGWAWIKYSRKTHIPWFSGMTWQSDVEISFGVPKSE